METMKLIQRIDQLATKTQLDGVEFKFDAFSENIQEKLYQFITKCKDNQKIIQRFDEVISEKASKISVSEIEDEIRQQSMISFIIKFIIAISNLTLIQI